MKFVTFLSSFIHSFHSFIHSFRTGGSLVVPTDYLYYTAGNGLKQHGKAANNPKVGKLGRESLRLLIHSFTKYPPLTLV